MKNDRFKAKLAALETLRANPNTATAVAALEKALTDRSNFIVAKAAAIVAAGSLTASLPHVIRAFERLIDDVEGDPGCRGKNALAKTLKALEHHDPAPFLRGVTHHQFEPVWGGQADTAGSLRATCAQALVACDIDSTFLLELLTDRFVDSDKAVRIEIAIAIAHLGRPESALLLRLKSLCGDREPEVVGQCLISLLDLDPVGAIAFVARFLSDANEDVRFEAMNALAQARAPDAIEQIVRFWNRERSVELRRSTVAALVASPVPAAADFLLRLITDPDDAIAIAAITALAASRFREEVRDRITAAVATSGRDALQRTFESQFRDASN